MAQRINQSESWEFSNILKLTQLTVKHGLPTATAHHMSESILFENVRVALFFVHVALYIVILL